jgi:hypothetical protein
MAFCVRIENKNGEKDDKPRYVVYYRGPQDIEGTASEDTASEEEAFFWCTFDREELIGDETLRLITVPSSQKPLAVLNIPASPGKSRAYILSLENPQYLEKNPNTLVASGDFRWLTAEELLWQRYNIELRKLLLSSYKALLANYLKINLSVPDQELVGYLETLAVEADREFQVTFGRYTRAVGLLNWLQEQKEKTQEEVSEKKKQLEKIRKSPEAKNTDEVAQEEVLASLKEEYRQALQKFCDLEKCIPKKKQEIRDLWQSLRHLRTRKLYVETLLPYLKEREGNPLNIEILSCDVSDDGDEILVTIKCGPFECLFAVTLGLDGLFLCSHNAFDALHPVNAERSINSETQAHLQEFREPLPEPKTPEHEKHFAN